MIKKIVNSLAMVAILFGTIAFAQSKIKPDPRLFECFTKEYINEIETNNPKLLAYYNFYLDNSYFISKEPTTKKLEGTDIFLVKFKDESNKFFNEDLSKFNSKNFNPLKYDFIVKQNVYTHYLLGNTGGVLIFYPMKRFMKEYKKYLLELGFQE